jgi:hypothetical protein
MLFIGGMFHYIGTLFIDITLVFDEQLLSAICNFIPRERFTPRGYCIIFMTRVFIFNSHLFLFHKRARALAHTDDVEWKIRQVLSYISV